MKKTFEEYQAEGIDPHEPVDWIIVDEAGNVVSSGTYPRITFEYLDETYEMGWLRGKGRPKIDRLVDGRIERRPDAPPEMPDFAQTSLFPYPEKRRAPAGNSLQPPR